MAETGWPLIPREVLPAPVPAAAKGTRRLAGPPADAGRQLSIFGAEATDPSPFDLAGLLAGPGRLGRMGGTARVAVQVDAAWRVHVLVAELVSRGLVVNWRPLNERDPDPGVRREHATARNGRDSDGTDSDDADPGHGDSNRAGNDEDHGDGDLSDTREDSGNGDDQREGGTDSDHADGSGTDSDRADRHGEQAGAVPRRPDAGVALFEVRTAYSSRLNGLARAWPAAAGQLFLSGPRLRLWVAAAGRPESGGYALGLDPDGPVAGVDAALRRAGLEGTVSDHGLDYLIVGRKRLARLAELVGQRPAAAPEALWPGGAPA